MKTINEVAGQDLSWYWNQAVYGTQVMDYEVMRADSNPVKWWDENLKEKKGETEYETQVILHRKGDFVFPVEAVVKFDNGESTIERWDGKDRWVRYVYRKKAQVESVQIDPAYQATMDRDYLNNSRVTESQHGAAHKTRDLLDVLHPIPGPDDELASLEEARMADEQKGVVAAGFGLLWRRQGVLWWVFVVNLVCGGLGAVPAMMTLQPGARAFPGRDRSSRSGFDLGMLAELIASALRQPDALDRHLLHHGVPVPAVHVVREWRDSGELSRRPQRLQRASSSPRREHSSGASSGWRCSRLFHSSLSG